jgi:4-diphosphocytidyl-2-C-methyl-D-erythritol kinase
MDHGDFGEKVKIALCADRNFMNEMLQYEELGRRLLVRAPAKINLCLLIAGKRPDGFHEIETLMAKIDLFDEVIIEAGASEGVELHCTGPHWAPTGQENLVYRAAQLLFDKSGLRPGVRLSLKKNIPAGSGLGSASSDAAATLIGLNRYFDLGVNRPDLAELGAQLGSDVPFFIYGPLSICRGRGERIQELQSPFDFTAALITPNVSVSTERVYKNYRHDPKEYGRLHVEFNHCIHENRIDFAPRMCANMLSESCFSLERGLAELKQRIESTGVGPLCLSGSGSAMFCLLENSGVQQLEAWSNILKHEIDSSCAIVQNIRW